MIKILSKLFLKSKDINSTVGRKTYGTLCSIVGIILNIILFSGKYFAGVITGSIAITADAFNNLSDAGSSFITLVGFWFAGKKPDTEHPFGHGRFEYISGLAVSILILLMGLELVQSSVAKILHPESIDTSTAAIIILILSIIVKIYMAIYNISIGKKIASSAMKATATDSLSDAAATFVVFISVLLNKYADINADGICGLLVAIFIILAGFSAIKETIAPLLGTTPDSDFVKEIKDIVMAHDGVVGIHDLMVHDYGPGRTIISLHTEVPGDGNIFQIHDMIDNIEEELHEKLSCEAVIHMDPIEVNNVVVNELKSMVKEIVKNIDTRLSIHDFRMVSGDTHTNLIFDVVVPYSVKMPDDEIRHSIYEGISQYDSQYIAIIKIERDYVGGM